MFLCTSFFVPSAFQPIPGTPLADKTPAPFMREHRLYQVDFLLRRYGFKFEDIPFDEQGQLSLEADPKTLWAQAHPEHFPVEINTAAPKELMRVPGIGPISVRRIMAIRHISRIRDLNDLRATGASYRIAAPYVLLDGKRPRMETQLSLF